MDVLLAAKRVTVMPVLHAVRWVLLLSLLTVAACGRGGGTNESHATGSATVSWSAPTASTDGSALKTLVGYRIYYGTDPDRLEHRIEIPDRTVTTRTVSGLTPGTWYFAVTAVGGDGLESALSQVGSKVIR